MSNRTFPSGCVAMSSNICVQGATITVFKKARPREVQWPPIVRTNPGNGNSVLTSGCFLHSESVNRALVNKIGDNSSLSLRLKRTNVMIYQSEKPFHIVCFISLSVISVRSRSIWFREWKIAPSRALKPLLSRLTTERYTCLKSKWFLPGFT